MTDILVYTLDLNPEPWAIGPLSTIRRGGKLIPVVGPNAQLKNYQEAVREVMHDKYPDVQPPVAGTHVLLDVWFWRQLEEYKTVQSRAARSHEADRTNLLKAFEDALQGIFYRNDKDVVGGRSWIVEQDFHTEPRIVFTITYTGRVRTVDSPPFVDYR